MAVNAHGEANSKLEVMRWLIDYICMSYSGGWDLNIHGYYQDMPEVLTYSARAKMCVHNFTHSFRTSEVSIRWDFG